MNETDSRIPGANLGLRVLVAGVVYACAAPPAVSMAPATNAADVVASMKDVTVTDAVASATTADANTVRNTDAVVDAAAAPHTTDAPLPGAPDLADSWEPDFGPPTSTSPTSCENGPTFAINLADRAGRVVEQEAGHLLVAGNGWAPAGSGAGPLVLARLNAEGTVMWQHEYAGVLGDFVDMAQGPADRIALLRRIGGGGGGANVVMTDGNGKQLWSKDYGPAANLGVTAIEATSTGKFAVVGVQGKTPVGYVRRFDASGALVAETLYPQFGGWWAATALPGDGLGVLGHGASGVVAKLAADGSMVWHTKVLGSTPHALTSTADGGLFIAGIVQDMNATTPAETFPQHLAVLRFDLAGNQLWKTEFNVVKPAEMHIARIAASADGGVRVGGSLADNGLQQLAMKNQPLPVGATLWHWYALWADAQGKVFAAKDYVPGDGGGVGGQSHDIAALCDGAVAVVGSGKASALPPQQGWVVRTDNNGAMPAPANVVVADLPVP